MSLRTLSYTKLSKRNLNSSGAIISSFGSDLNYGQTSLLLHGDGTNGGQNQTFLDSSTNNFTVTRNGNATQGSFSPFSQPDGYWSNYFDGSSYLQIASNSALNMDTYACLECWVYFSSLSSSRLVIGRDSSYWLGYDFTGINGASNKFVFAINNSSSWQAVSATSTVSAGVWYHIVGIKDNTTLRIYINGVQENTASFSGTPYTGATPFGVASNQNTQNMTGYVTNGRVIIGTSSSVLPYTSNFTPPTTPLTAVTNTKLLTCQSNRFKDNSTNGFSITIAGSPSVQLFSPLSSSTPYVAATNGGSGYFDGSGDYLNTSVSAIGTGDFTIEYWSYLNALNGAGQPGYFQISDTAGGLKTTYTTGVLALDNTALYVNVGGTTIATSHTLVKYQWFHTAIVRSSGTVSVYVNGVLVSTPTSITTNLTGTYLAIGGYYSTSYLIPGGYISDFRVITGTALYTTTFTPPTAPLTAVTNTKFLCNFINAGILDSTGQNDFETVGNAQISTGQSKFGGSSMYFDGNASYLKFASNQSFAFGTGDFTIEYWMYSNDVSSATQKGLFQTSDTAGGLKTTYTTGLFMGQGYTSSGNLDGAIRVNINGTNLGSSSAVLTTGTWYHIALVRANGVVTIYVNGNSVASGTISSSITGTNLAVGCYYSTSYGFNGYIDDFRVTPGIARYLYNFIPPTLGYPNSGYSSYTPPTTDSYFGQTPLLLHGDGSSGVQNNTFLDGSTNAFTITRNGNATQGTFSPFSRADGYWSNYFNGSTDYLSISNNAALNLGTVDFTIEMWLYPFSVNAGNANPVLSQLTSAGNTGWLLGMSSGSLWQFSTGNTVIVRSGNVSLNQWTHLAAVRSSGTTTLYVNGVSVGNTSTSFNFTDTASLLIGYQSAFNIYFNGYVSNARIVKGTALYTSNFTPSTTPLTAVTNTSLLTCQSNRFKDNSTNAFAITPSGSPQVQTFIPFEPTAPYSAINNGGGMYFDGSGDYLNAGSNSVFAFGTGAYTVEFWAYPSSISQQVYFFNDTTGGSGFYFETSGSAGFTIAPRATGVPALTGGYSNLQANAWNHIVFCRASTSTNQTSIFVNGTRVANGTDNNNWTITGPALVGGLTAGIYMFSGHMSNVRIVKGTDVYGYNNTTITVPTAPLTAVANTQLLLSGTNAGIIDSTGTNNLETVSSTQVLSNQYKFGSGSMYFNGSSYLNMPGSPNFVMKGDYTLECWIYNTGTTATIFDQWIGSTSGQGNYQFYINSSYKFDFYYDGLSIITHPTVMSTNTWYHLAAVRLGSTIRTYVNGLSGPTASSSLVLGRSDYTLWIGAQHQGGPSNYFTGYVDDARMTNGICRYPYNFTIPASAYPNN